MKTAIPLAFLLCVLVPGAGAVTNSLTLKEEAGVTTVNYPVQIARPFLEGEITGFPQVLVNGNPVLTQADVKQRYQDNSVKHAILTFYIPSLPANGTATITFQNQSTGNNTGALNATSMLGGNFDFDAKMELTNGVTKTASARTMLQDNNFSYWLQGLNATSIILADHSANRSYDLGFDAYQPFRPIFHATFFPLTNQVRVRFIGESANTEELEDMDYALALKTGFNNPLTCYTKSLFTHYGGSRWTKEFWLGGTPGNISINPHLEYLRETAFVPYHDMSKVIPQNVISSDYANWQNAFTDLYDAGFWTKVMGTGGARPEIGPLPSWTVAWLYTGDKRSQEIAFKSAELAASWPMHLREGDPSKLFLRNNTSVQGLGKIMSVTSRPTLCIGCGYNYAYTLPGDQINVVGSLTTGSWDPDDAHQPDPFSVQYITTGDFFYLEEMYFWASWSAGYSNGAAYNYDYGRGPTGAEGGLAGQLRGQAWVFRNRTITAFAAPDNTDEKNYFSTLTDDAIQVWEGAKNIQTTSNYGSPNWTWGYNLRYDNVMGNPPLNQWERGGTAFSQSGYGIETSVTLEALSNFEQHYFLYSIGRGKDLGFETDALLSYLAQHYIGAATDPGYNRYLLCNGRVPTVRASDGQWFSTWSDLKTGYNSSWQNKTSFDTLYPYDYTFLALAGMSFIKCEPGGMAAWAVAENEMLPSTVLHTDPKFALVPKENCTITSVPVQQDASGGLLLFPNPSGGIVTITGPAISLVTVYDITGRELLLQQENGQNETTVDLGTLRKGCYMLKVRSGNELYVHRVLIR